MSEHVPTVDEVIDSLVYCYKQAGVRNYFWQCADGALSEVPENELRPALEDAYDSSMPNWVALVQLD